MTDRLGQPLPPSHALTSKPAASPISSHPFLLSEWVEAHRGKSETWTQKTLSCPNSVTWLVALVSHHGEVGLS